MKSVTTSLCQSPIPHFLRSSAKRSHPDTVFSVFHEAFFQNQITRNNYDSKQDKPSLLVCSNLSCFFLSILAFIFFFFFLVFLLIYLFSFAVSVGSFSTYKFKSLLNVVTARKRVEGEKGLLTGEKLESFRE